MKPFTARKEKKPLEDFTAVELTHRYLQPSEWVGKLDTADTLYMVANHRIIKIVKAPDMWKALVALKADDYMEAKHQGIDARVTSEQMLKVTGLNLKCEVKENISGEILPNA